ncbi:hypothetical protein QQY66_25100 [Streptomyces sp. DG2A-72]|uniref:hypothetical protein n=1 Tax=Streptomyces sp. DG2A-72 TaxID=3051386 RepID=UPI00265B7C0B|nr:hypothetical protein [Streptomyces sp. DG2A-72]MDO0934798.1 hypothetical protein [Streptomyces sp. DG2A-72]
MPVFVPEGSWSSPPPSDGTLTVSVTGVVRVVPAALVNSARYRYPSCDALAVKVYAFRVALSTAVHGLVGRDEPDLTPPVNRW